MQANCSDNSIKYSNVPLGIFYTCHALLYYPFYIPCAIVIFKTPNLIKKSCYKLMAALAVIDMLTLLGNGFMAGIWSVLGTSYCDNFWKMKIVGAFSNGCWITYCALCISLSINRATDLKDSPWNKRLFDGSKTFYWVGASLCWGGLYMLVYLTPFATLIYHSGWGVYLFDPEKPGKLGHWMNLFNNEATFVVMAISYVVVASQMRKMASHLSNEQSQYRINAIKNKRRVTLTSLLVCGCAGITCVGYAIVPLVSTQAWHLTLTAFFWQLTNGSNCFIYLFFNTKIRKGVKKLFGFSQATVTPLDMVSRFMKPQALAVENLNQIQ